MAWSAARWIREVHFTVSLLLGLILMFYAFTGLMADNRDLFGARADRDDVGTERPFGGDLRCDGAVLKTAVAQAFPEEALGEPTPRDGWVWLSLDDDRQRAVCKQGHDEWYLGRVEPIPAGMPRKGDGRTQWVREQFGGHKAGDEEKGLADTVARVHTVWTITTIAVDRDATHWTIFDNHQRWQHVLIELHKGRERGDWLVEITFALALVTALTGVLHGMRFKGKRRRILIAAILASALLLGWVIAS